MFPMIATLEELRAAKRILAEEQAATASETSAAASVKVGIMVEVPSAAVQADILAAECDFFSIGTNDLTQYTLAMDRGHPKLARQADGLHPAVLRMIKLTTDGARKHGKWVGVCGGIASDLIAIPVLIGLGVKELSVTVPDDPGDQGRHRQALPVRMPSPGRGSAGAGNGGAGPGAAGAFRGITVDDQEDQTKKN